MPTSSLLSKNHIESVLANHFGRRHCCLTFRGTTALTAALAALELPSGFGVIFPSVMCSIPVFAAVFAGGRPLFADVSLADGNFDLTDLERVLKAEGKNVGAVIPVHMFGRPDNLDILQTLCDRFGVALIEDVALSMGARYKGRPVGGFGRLSCLSFVRKMIPLEMGGAVLTDDPVLDQRARRFVDQLPPPSEGIQAQTAAAMKAFHSLTGYVATHDWKNKSLLTPFQLEFQRLLLAGTSEADWRDSIVLKELESLPDALQARRVRAEVLETALQHECLQPLRHEESCYFAYPVRMKRLSVEGFLHFASARGYAFKRISYPDIHPIFSERRSFPQAEIVEREVLGFPVDDDQPVSAFWEYARDFLMVLEDYRRAAPSLPPFDDRGKLELRMG